MRMRRRVGLVTLLFVIASCAEPQGPPAWIELPPPTARVVPAVRFAEIHYDNTGTDVGEAIEISGPAGMDVTGWTIVLYNGNGGVSYNTQALSGTIPATCTDRGVIVINYPTNGIQNGGTGAATDSPDGMALVDASGTVIEFLSYEGVFAATNGAALGVTSTDILVRELGTEPAGQSLARHAVGTWSAPATSSFGACNDNDTPPADVASVVVAPATATVAVGGAQQFTATAFDAANVAIGGVVFVWSSDATGVATVDATGRATGVATGDANISATAPNGVGGSAALHVNPVTPPGVPTVHLSEIHYDNSGTDVGEAIEVEGPAGTDLTGWAVVLYNGNGGVSYNTTGLSGAIPALCSGRGVVVVNYPVNGIQNGSPDGMALVDGTGTLVEFLSYEGTFAGADGAATGLTATDIGVSEGNEGPGQSLQRDDTGAWHAPRTASFGACNDFTAPPPPAANTIQFTGRLPSDPPLPVGFQDQLFATLRDPANVVIPTTFTWSSETPTIATIDQNGVVTALAAGTLIVRATAAEGTTATFSLPTRVGVASTTAQYAGNAEFGEPADADPSDDFIVRHPEYTASYSSVRNTPNWVSYDLDATHFGAEDRCDCFTFDPDLPASFFHYTTNDYTGAGAIAGFGIDRGHLARSFDRTSSSLDNAHSFLFSNIVPQAADLNQGPWAILENQLGDSARLGNREVYIVAGPAGNRGTVKNEGKIVIPTSTWKVALILPRDHGLADVHSAQDFSLIAVNMPNDPGVRNVPWQTYITTVDAIEALTGYDLLALLPDQIEIAVESNTQPPVAATDGPYAGSEGGSVAMSGVGSTDADGDALTYAWDFGDGTTGSGASVTHTYTQDGVYTVRLTVTDSRGLTGDVFTTASIANVAPVVGAFAGATLFPGETYAASGSFTDPGADPWGATVDYGDGSGASSLALSGKTFTLLHTYTVPGSFTVTVRVTDDDASSAGSATVSVLTAPHGIASAQALVQQLIDAGKLPRLAGTALRIELAIALRQIELDRPRLGAGVLEGVVQTIDALVRAGKVSASDIAPLRALVVRIKQSLVVPLS